jgi:uncharacterized protein (DUF697 family)
MTENVQNDEVAEVVEDVNQEDLSDRVVRNHMITSMAVGLVPVPLLDLVGITGVQLNMLRKLAAVYEVPFLDHRVKTILASLIGGGSSLPIAATLFSLVKAVPIVGTSIGAVSMPITAGATTYAVGKVFQQHFASGGTFLTFNPDKVKEYYAHMLKKGKEVAGSVDPDTAEAAKAGAKA